MRKLLPNLAQAQQKNLSLMLLDHTVAFLVVESLPLSPTMKFLHIPKKLRLSLKNTPLFPSLACFGGFKPSLLPSVFPDMSPS